MAEQLWEEVGPRNYFRMKIPHVLDHTSLLHQDTLTGGAGSGCHASVRRGEPMPGHAPTSFYYSSLRLGSLVPPLPSFSFPPAELGSSLKLRPGVFSSRNKASASHNSGANGYIIVTIVSGAPWSWASLWSCSRETAQPQPPATPHIAH